MKEVDDVEKCIINILHSHFEIPESITQNKENFNRALTGDVFCFDSIKMVYFIKLIEMQTGIQFTAKEMDNYGLSTLNKILKVLSKR